MSSELRAKIANTIQECHRKGIAHYGEIAEHILALEGYIDRTPPATAKLPEGVVVCAMPDGRYHVRGCGWWLLKQGRWEKITLPTHEYPGEFVSHDDALTAALAAPPVPGESKPTLGTSTRCSTCGFDGMNHMSTAARDAETIRSQAARIAELEAENARLRAQYDMVEQERTRLMLGQQVPYTPAEKPDARNFVATGEQRQDDYYEKPITEMKPDPLARAVTVGEFNEKMQRLADIYVRAGMPTTAKFIRDAFTSTQGAAHAE